MVKWYMDWEIKHFPKITRWWRGLNPAIRWLFRGIAILAIIGALRK